MIRDVSRLFGPRGPLAGHKPDFRERPQQVAFAQAVSRALERDQVLLAEAGTGTGKTLGYLVPIVASGAKAVISTGTKGLQEQIFYKDLQFVARSLGVSVSACCLKGQENYLCVRRLDELSRSPEALSYDSAQLGALQEWARITTSGDRSELSDWADDDPLWHRVCSTLETRMGRRCPFHDACFVTQARRRAQESRIVVVNHHLYFSDVASRSGHGGLLPRHEVVVFDEAHLIEDIATEFFSVRVSEYRIEDALQGVVRACAAADLRADASRSARRVDLVTKAGSLCRAVFDGVRRIVGVTPSRVPLDPAVFAEDLREDCDRLDQAIEGVVAGVEPLAASDETIAHAAEQLAQVLADWRVVVERRLSDHVYWTQVGHRSVQLGATPLHVGDVFCDRVLTQVPAVVLCSATLATGAEDGFAYVKSRLGIDMDCEELQVGTPFDYGAQCRLYVPRLPDPRHADWFDAAVGEAVRLIRLTDGGCLVLCTAVSTMRALAQALQQRWDGPVRCQGDAPKNALVAFLEQTPRAVLVATASFRQGVDLPGDALRLVIMDKLPFAPPGDPVVHARIQRLRERGEDAFRTYQLPQAALSLKQAFGRLIRTESDRGIAAILDGRMHTQRYGAFLLNALPPVPLVDWFEDLAAWWRSDVQGHTGDLVQTT